MKNASIFIVVFMLGMHTQVMAQPPSVPGAGMPGIQQMITQYGDELNLTEEQKETLIGMSLDQRRERQRIRMRPERRFHSEWRGNRNTDREHNEQRELRDRGDNEQREYQRDRNNRGRTVMLRQADIYQKVYDILTDEQEETLKSLLTDHANRQHEYRTLRYEKIVERAGIEEGKADQIKEIFEKQSRTRADLSIQRIQNPGEIDRERFQEISLSVREGNRQVKEILTAAEYEKLLREMSPADHRQQPSLRRSATRSR